jgi:hypothetical protein
MAITNSTVTDSTAAAVYSSTGNTAVTTVYLCNKTPTSCIVNLFVVSSGFQANGENIIYSNLVIAGDDTYIMEAERLLFTSGDSLAANTNIANSVVATTSFTSI